MRSWTAPSILLLASMFSCLLMRAAVADLAPVVTLDEVPMPTCQPPLQPPRVAPPPGAYERLDRELAAYRVCVEDYVHAREAEMKRHNALAKANAEAANTAVQHLNEFMTKLTADQ